MTSDRNTVLKFCEPKETSRETLFDRLLKGTYRKPFLVEDLEHRAMCFALKWMYTDRNAPRRS